MKKLLAWLLFYAAMAQAATPWVETNYQVATPGTPISVSVKLDPNGSNAPADWFSGFYNPSVGLYHYDLIQGLKKDSTTLDTAVLQPTYQGPLTQLATTVSFGTLPAGHNTVFFGVDTTMDGKVTPGYTVTTTAVDVIKVGTECVIDVRKVQDHGYTGNFNIRVNHSGINTAPAEQYFVHGQQYPNGPWVKYPVQYQYNDFGAVLNLEWPNSQPFEFSIGKTVGGKDYYADPSCSRFRYPENAAPDLQHFRLVLGTKKVCGKNNTGDTLITGIYNLGGTLRRVYVDFAQLPIRNYRKIAVNGQSAPDNAWVDYTVTDQFPCFYTDVNWPSTGLGFELSFYVVKEDGSTQWIDPIPSKYLYNGHFRIPAETFAQAPPHP